MNFSESRRMGAYFAFSGKKERGVVPRLLAIEVLSFRVHTNSTGESERSWGRARNTVYVDNR